MSLCVKTEKEIYSEVGKDGEPGSLTQLNPWTSRKEIHCQKIWKGTSLVVQWLGSRLPMQGTWIRALVPEDPTCRRAAKPVRHSYWACALEPASHNYWSPRATNTKAHVPRARAPQQEKPPQWEACAPQRRVAPARRNYRKPARSNTQQSQDK